MSDFNTKKREKKIQKEMTQIIIIIIILFLFRNNETFKFIPAEFYFNNKLRVSFEIALRKIFKMFSNKLK